jgi:ribonuclease I
MSLQLVLVCLFLASGCLSFEAAAVDYDYLQAVFQWPKAFCENQNVNCISNLPNNFTMHGVWPSNMTQSGHPTVRIEGDRCQQQNNLPSFEPQQVDFKLTPLISFYIT